MANLAYHPARQQDLSAVMEARLCCNSEEDILASALFAARQLGYDKLKTLQLKVI